MGDNEIEIVVDVDDRASNKMDSIVRAAGKLGGIAADAVGGLMRSMIGAGQAAGQMAAQMASSATSAGIMAAGGTVATGGLNLLAVAALGAAAAIPALIGALVSLAPALASVGGLAGVAIAGLFGVATAAATLGVGLGGISEAWNAYGKSAGGGGGASKAAGDQAYQAARRIEQAEEALTRAKRSAREASLAVNEAREQERERIEDLTLALRGQKYAQMDALDAVKAAEEKLARENAYGNSNTQQAAQAEVDRAKYRYDYETERLKDLEKDKKEADRNGIEGSKQVQDALKRERDAADAVRQAMDSLADAKRKVATASGGAGGGINAFADAMSKLSPNAQKFVRTLIELKERFEGVKRAVQDRLFAGLDVTLRNLAEKWGPHLVPILGGMADSFNRIAKGIAEGLGDSEFIANVATMSEAFGGFMERLGEAAVDLIDAFARIGAAASPILEKIGDAIARIADRFAKWIEEAEKSGDLESFMERAAYYLGLIKDIGGLALGILWEFIKILFPPSDEVGGGVLEGVKKSLEEVKEWLGDPKNQQRIRDMFAKFDDFFDKLVNEWIPDLKKFASDFGKLVGPIARVVGWLSNVHNFLTVKIPNAISSMAKRGGNVFDGVKNGFRAAINWIIGKWNSLSFSLPSVSFLGQQIGGGTIGTPHVDYLASGGISGSGRVVMNEQGPEAVRLPQGSMVYSAGDSKRMMSGQNNGVQRLDVHVNRTTERGVIDAVMSMLRFEISSGYGGDVQLALGENRG